MNRKLCVYALLCAFHLLFVSLPAKGQDIGNLSQLKPEDYSSLTLPSLDLLFENAKQAPAYELAQVQEQIERKLLSKEKRAFLGFFNLRGSYQWGKFGNDYTFTDVYNPVVYNYATSKQISYTLGAAVNIPLDDLLDLGSRVKRQKLSVKSAELQREIKYEEMKKEIVQLYAAAVAQLNVLKLRAEALMLANVQYEIAEKDFSNGAMTSGDLSIEKERQSTAQERFENSKFELTKSLMVLEVITRTPIIQN
ncbi:TolC family protein [Bacteroides sp.]